MLSSTLIPSGALGMYYLCNIKKKICLGTRLYAASWILLRAAVYKEIPGIPL